MISDFIAAVVITAGIAFSANPDPVQLVKTIEQQIFPEPANPFEKHGKFERMKIVYTAMGKEVVLTAEDVIDWVRFWPDGHWDIDDDKIAEYITYLQDEFNTSGHTKYLKTTMGDTVAIEKGDYGWKINRAEEIREISQLLRNNGTTYHELHFEKTAALTGNPYRDYGDSYIEIDLSKQVLWMYEEGDLTLVSNIVSGLMNTDCQTPSGAYSLYYKQAPAVLVGADYETPVSYWMPFNGGIGLHDATWQPSFGGDACYYRGSHGCINLPLEIAGAIYEKIEKGFPILCYYSNPEEE